MKFIVEKSISLVGEFPAVFDFCCQRIAVSKPTETTPFAGHFKIQRADPQYGYIEATCGNGMGNTLILQVTVTPQPGTCIIAMRCGLEGVAFINGGVTKRALDNVIWTITRR